MNSSLQMYYGKQDPRWASNVLPNCRVCPDFAIRFFCPQRDNQPTKCITKEEWKIYIDHLAEV